MELVGGVTVHFPSLDLSFLTYKERTLGSMSSNESFKSERHRSMLDHAERVQDLCEFLFPSFPLDFSVIWNSILEPLLLWVGSLWISCWWLFDSYIQPKYISWTSWPKFLMPSGHTLTVPQGSSNNVFKTVFIIFASNMFLSLDHLFQWVGPLSHQRQKPENQLFIYFLSP